MLVGVLSLELFLFVVKNFTELANLDFFGIHGDMGYSQKRFMLMCRWHQHLSEFLAKGHLPQVSRQSRRSLMIRVIMKWSRQLCTDLLAFALHLRKTLRKSQLGDRLMKGMCDQSSPGPFPPNEVGMIAQHVRKGEVRKEGKDGVYVFKYYSLYRNQFHRGIWHFL